MALTNIIDCVSLTPALKKPLCGFVPQRVSKVVGWSKDVSFDPATDSFNDATFSPLVQAGKMWSFDVPVTTDNTPDSTYETIEGLDKKTSDGVVDMDFTLRCLTMCEIAEYKKMNSNWNLAFEIEDAEGNTKLFVAVKADGTVTGFDVNVLGVKSSKFGTTSTATTLIMRVQFSRKGTKQFNLSSDIYDIDVDLCDYNSGNIQVQEVDPVSLTPNMVTINHRYVDDCDGQTPIEGVGTGNVGVALFASNGSGQVVGTSTPDANDPSIVSTVFDLTGSTVIGSNPFYTQLWDTVLNEPIVKLNDCFYRGASGTFTI